jgi:hypothetical protein
MQPKATNNSFLKLIAQRIKAFLKQKKLLLADFFR